MLASETDRNWHRGYVSGSFDMFHIGHLNLIRRAKERCDHLTVGVTTDDYIARVKKKWPVFPLEDRVEIIRALKYVDEVDVTTAPLLNKIIAWEKYQFDAMFSGDDHMDDGWAGEEADLKARGVDLVFFPYTRKITSSLLQEIILPPKTSGSDIPQSVAPFRRLFPFDRVNKGEHIVIYGTGKIGLQYAAQLATIDYCKIFAFVNTFTKEGTLFAGKPCLTPRQLSQNLDNFDRIVIASVTYHGEILNVLRSVGIPPERIA